jgi:hypothetical protein
MERKNNLFPLPLFALVLNSPRTPEVQNEVRFRIATLSSVQKAMVLNSVA